MTPSMRQAKIVELARQQGEVSVEELVAAFDVTPQTIRKDLNILCDRGALKRTHGGAMHPSGVENVEYEARRQIAPGEKRAIGRAAAALIPDHASLFINIGTTTEAVAQALSERFGGDVPGAMKDLVTIPGVGRKTANVVRSVALGRPGLPVDTHVARLSRRLGLTTETDPVKIEHELNSMIPAAERGLFSLRLILHGRRVCLARKPRCGECVLADFCPSAQI